MLENITHMASCQVAVKCLRVFNQRHRYYECGRCGTMDQEPNRNLYNIFGRQRREIGFEIRC